MISPTDQRFCNTEPRKTEKHERFSGGPLGETDVGDSRSSGK